MPERQPHVHRAELSAQPLPENAAEPTPTPAFAGTRFVISCEHGGKRVPPNCRDLFAGHEALLCSHRGHDPGALVLARDFARALQAPLVTATNSRLLIDLNRSPGHPALYSEIMRGAPREMREAMFTGYYLPYRRRVEQHVAEGLARGAQVVHISSHSFTPVLDGRVRNADAGFLYDPARAAERALCLRWIAALQARAPQLKLRRNYPYAGRSDGFCAWLRRQYPSGYVGVELEVNQRHYIAGGAAWRRLCADLVAALLQALDYNAPARLTPSPAVGASRE